jgi:hypothetical protein
MQFVLVHIKEFSSNAQSLISGTTPERIEEFVP